MENFTYPHEKQSTLLSVRIPDWIKSVDEIAEEYSLNPARLRIMLHQFFLCYIKNERLRKSKSGANYLDEYFPVSSQLLRRTCTDNYKLYVDTLIEAGIVECHVNKMGGKSYLPGSHAQLYRWLGSSPYSFRSETITERIVIKSVLRTRDMYAKKCKESAFELSDDNHVYSYMLACCNEVVLPDLHSPKEIESDIGVLGAEAFLTGDLTWFKVDTFGRRLHTPRSLRCRRKQESNSDLSRSPIPNW